MKNTKLVKARCTVTNAAFVVEVRKKGTQWQAIDFVRLTDVQDKKLESQIDVSSLETAPTLLACTKCGNRQLGGCGCHKSKADCRAEAAYDFQCIYCKSMEIDNSAASDLVEGEVLRLAQGQEIKLARRGAAISRLEVGMGWRPSVTSESMDLDSSVVLINESGAVDELVYYGHLSDCSGAIEHHGDNLYGSETSEDDENITINLSKLPRKIKCLAFIVNIYEAYEREQALVDVRDMHIRLIEKSTGQVLARYDTSSDQEGATALLIGAAYRRGESWVFKAMNDVYTVEDVDELAQLSCIRCKTLLGK